MIDRCVLLQADQGSPADAEGEGGGGEDDAQGEDEAPQTAGSRRESETAPVRQRLPCPCGTSRAWTQTNVRLCLYRKLAEDKYEEIHRRRTELRSRHFQSSSLDLLSVRWRHRLQVHHPLANELSPSTNRRAEPVAAFQSARRVAAPQGVRRSWTQTVSLFTDLESVAGESSVTLCCVSSSALN